MGKKKEEAEALLPDKLESGMKLRGPKGLVVIIKCTGSRNAEDEPLYRVVYEGGTLSNGRWTRDEFQELGYVEA